MVGQGKPVCIIEVLLYPGFNVCGQMGRGCNNDVIVGEFLLYPMLFLRLTVFCHTICKQCFVMTDLDVL